MSKVTSDTKLDALVEDIRAVAKAIGVGPRELTRDAYWDARGTKVSKDDLNKFGGWTNIMKAYFPSPIDAPVVARLGDLQKGYNRAIQRTGSYENFVNDYLKGLEELPKFDPRFLKPEFNHKKLVTERAINLVLSDLHIGANLKETSTNKPYGTVEEARSLAQIIRTTCEYKRDHRKQTVLHVWLLGDVIHGNIHRATQAPVIEQFKRAVYLLSQAIANLAREFGQVQVHCATGNHGRNPSIHLQRAIDNKEDSYETMIYYALSHKFSDVEHVRFDIPNSPEVTASVLGHRFYATHGDTLLKPGNPGQNIKTGLIESEINAIDRNEVADGREPFSIYIVGHVHKATVLGLDFGGTLVINGGMPPADAFAKSVRVHRAQQCQVLFESTKAVAFGDYRKILVNESLTKNDKGLDAVIKPFEP